MVRREAARRDGGGVAGWRAEGPGLWEAETGELGEHGGELRAETRTEPCGKWMWAHVWCQHRQTHWYQVMAL